MKELTPQLLDEIARRLVDALQPLRIYLFGSHAAGTPNRDSDVDLLVVVDRAAPSRCELVYRGHMSLRGVPTPVDLLVYTAEDVDKWAAVPCNLIHTVAQKGRLLYAAEDAASSNTPRRAGPRHASHAGLRHGAAPRG